MLKGILCPSKKKCQLDWASPPHLCFWKASSKLPCGKKQDLQIPGMHKRLLLALLMPPVLAFPYFRGKGWSFSCLQSLCRLPIFSPPAASSPSPAFEPTANILTELRQAAITLLVLLARLGGWQPLGLHSSTVCLTSVLSFYSHFFSSDCNISAIFTGSGGKSLQAVEKNLLAWAEDVTVRWSLGAELSNVNFQGILAVQNWIQNPITVWHW